MSPALDRIRTEAALLDVNERARMAQELLESLDAEPTTDDIESAWNDEAVRRLEAYKRGEIPTMSAEDVHSGAPISGSR